MRDILVTLLFVFGAWQTLRQTYRGILLWSWLGYMNPHRLCWGFAYSLPFSYITAILTCISYFFSKERKKLPNDKLVTFYLLFIAWMGTTTIFAFDADIAFSYFIRVLKIQFPILMTLILFSDKNRLHQLLWVMAISVGYFGIKGGVFTVMTGGGYRIYGPPDSFIEENNSLAVASLMIMFLMIYLRTTLEKSWQKHIMMFCLISLVFSILGSQSRGALLAVFAVGGYFWIQSKNKMASALLILILAGMLAVFMPESWYSRMSTIDEYQEDDSAMGRIRAWTMAVNVANHNLFGGGFSIWNARTYLEYSDSFRPGMDAFVAHSIYFHVLGEHGWVGLFLFLSCFFLTWRYCSQLVNLCQGDHQRQWIADLSRMIRLSILAYLSGGAFLSLSYLDLPWHLIAITVLLKEQAKLLAHTEEERSPKTNRLSSINATRT